VSVCVICVIYVGREEERRTGLVEKRKRLSAVLLDCRDALGMVIVLWLYCFHIVEGGDVFSSEERELRWTTVHDQMQVFALFLKLLSLRIRVTYHVPVGRVPIAPKPVGMGKGRSEMQRKLFAL
jgi:hypothetical protein